MADSSQAPRSPEAPSTAKAPSPRAEATPPKSKTASPRSAGSPEAEIPGQTTEPATQQAEIEVDEGIADRDSVTDEQLSISGYTTSVTSSVYDYPTENGRRYHAFRHGTYYGPNDAVTAHSSFSNLSSIEDEQNEQDELDRLDFNASFLTKLTQNQLHHAPLEQGKVHRILDIGTGTGIWAIEIADLFPDAEVIGNDLSPVQSEWVPPNVKFEVDDVESPWVAPKYDFIYCRFMAGAIADWPRLVKNTFKNTHPGGWVEFQDWDLLFKSDDGSITDDHYSMKMIKMFMEGSRKVGREPSPGPLLEPLMREAGFVNIHHKQIKCPLGMWPKDPYLRDLGHMNMIQALDGLEAYNLRLYTGVLGWTVAEAQVLFAHVRNEIRNNAFHAYMVYHVVYGQVPESKK